MDAEFVITLFVVLLIAGVLSYVWIARPIAPAPAPASNEKDTQAPERVYKPESWCLMSEDVLGRWCSPNIATCPAHRFYTSREACELVDASAMPLTFSVSSNSFRSERVPLEIVTETRSGKQHVLPLARAALLGVSV
jgi:hypothetical protein